MFRVEENLMLTRNAMIPNSYVVEECKTYVPELADFYVCLPKDRISVIKDYIETLQNASFILKTFEADPVNGLQLLLRIEKANSYTEEFVKYYGSPQGIFAAFHAAEQEQVEETTTVSEETASQSEEFISPPEMPADMIEEVHVADFRQMTDDSASSDAMVTGNTSDSEESENVEIPLADDYQTEEIMLMIRGIASKLGVIGYDDSKILSKSEMATAQEAIMTLSTVTIREAVVGAIGLAESKEDLASITRFLELFFIYIKENNLKR